jgi:SAM-dependent methyltransferase
MTSRREHDGRTHDSVTVARYGASEHYRGERGLAYGERRTPRSHPHLALLQAAKFTHAVNPDDTVVDFGCGSGDILANVPCRRRIGIEINPQAQALAAERGIEVFESTEMLPSACADVVMSHHALEHVPYPIAALIEMRRLLKPGGVLLLRLPVDDWRRQKRYDPSDVNHHLHTWTPQHLGNSLWEAGFDAGPGDIRLVTTSLHPALLPLYRRLPMPVFDGLRVAWALFRSYRELAAEVTVAPSSSYDLPPRAYE